MTSNVVVQADFDGNERVKVRSLGPKTCAVSQKPSKRRKRDNPQRSRSYISLVRSKVFRKQSSTRAVSRAVSYRCVVCVFRRKSKVVWSDGNCLLQKQVCMLGLLLKHSRRPDTTTLRFMRNPSCDRKSLGSFLDTDQKKKLPKEKTDPPSKEKTPMSSVSILIN